MSLLPIKKFVELVSKKLKINLKWKGKGINEIGYNSNNGKVIVDLSKKHFRPTEVDFLRGDFTKARKYLKWKPEISTNQLIDDMIKAELSVE